MHLHARFLVCTEVWVRSCVPVNACFSMGARMCVQLEVCLCMSCGLEGENKNIYVVVMSAVAPVLKKDQGHTALWLRFSLR